MKVLVVGATGATGRLVVKQLLERGDEVRAVARSMTHLEEDKQKYQDRLEVKLGSLLDFNDKEFEDLVEDCAAVVSCLGHTVSLRGIACPPYRLCRDAVKRLCKSIDAKKPDEKVKFILMNSTGCRNPENDPSRSWTETAVIGLLRYLLPPHTDNEQAQAVLRGISSPYLSWAAVRPDDLIDEDLVSPYTEHPAPTRSCIFDAGKTSRVNVAHFMCELIHNPDVWGRWVGQTPVIYNRQGAEDKKEK